jgi:hypothetical protein
VSVSETSVSNGRDQATDKGATSMTSDRSASSVGDSTQSQKSLVLAYNCNASVGQCEEFDRGLDVVRRTSQDSAMTEEERGRLGAAHNSYGKKGEAGVDISSQKN